MLLGKKATTNLDSLLKSRDITLPIKVCIVKAMVFSVVMYGCESWTIKLSAKECSNDRTTVLISHTSKVMLKILQARL